LRRYLRTAAALGAAITLAACSAGEDTASTPQAAPDESDKGCDSIDLDSPPDSPVSIRIGHGAASEEPFWLLAVNDELATHKGSWYDMDLKPFRGTGERLTAYQAGELDAVVISPQAQIQGTARGALDLYAVATIMREGGEDAFSTSFVALEGSGIEGTDDLQGKRIAIIDEGSQLDFLARQGIAQGGGDPDRDAEYVVFPFPAQEEALRGGQIDVAGLPEPFYTLAMSKGGVAHVFDAADVSDFSYDLLTMSFDREFLEENMGAVCAWASDFRQSMDYWKTENEAARKQLVGTDFVPLPEPIYMQTGDYERPDDGTVDTEGMTNMIDQMVEFGILEESDRVDPKTLVREGVSIGH
jgi:ABC-type nitrate/sulfonate/bicarbonate transport system substrate-binding protein